MTEQDRKVLEEKAGKVRPKIAFKLGKIVAIDEILTVMEDAVADDRGVSGEALTAAMFLIYDDIKRKLTDAVIAACEDMAE